MLSIKDKILLSPIWLISRMPLWMGLIISWILYFLIYHVAGYRKKVVFRNLKNSFPNKTKKEITCIAKKFYLHLCDQVFESLYMARMGPKEIIKRYKLDKNNEFDKLYTEGKDAILMMGHYANWEWTSSAKLQIPHHAIGTYKPLMNKLFDRFFLYLRSKHGCEMTSMKNTFRSIVKLRNNDERFALLLIGDQRPFPHEINLWVNFLNQDTPAILGAEKMAIKFDTPIIFLDVKKVKRGYYKLTTEILVKKPKETKEYEITKLFFKRLEKQINECPEYYLWSHNRWKFTKKGVEEHNKKHRTKRQPTQAGKQN